MRHTARALVIAVAMVVSATEALAVDGVVLIDQSKALAGNVTPGDTAGFPVSINQPGSYRLTSNLVVASADTTAIEINAIGVALDLNGFSIIGPSVCSGFPLTCAPIGSGNGVSISSTGRGASVRNGTITGMGSAGVSAFASATTIENLSVFSNGGNGILAQLTTVHNNRVLRNGGNGITGGNGVFTGNLVSGNRFNGIDVNDSIVTNNAMIVNGGFGLAASNSGFGSNTFSSNNGSFANPQFTGRVAIAPNSCDGNLCP